MLRVFLCIGLIGALTPVWACSCAGPEESFLVPGAATQGIVVCVEKLRTIEHGMEVKVINQLSGPEVGKRLRVWGDLGWLCRSYTTGFEDGKTYILRIDPLPDPIPAYWPEQISALEQAGDFSLSVCGLHFLEVVGGKVQTAWGTIDGQETEMPLGEFKRLMEVYRTIQFSFEQRPGEPVLRIVLAETVTEPGWIEMWDMAAKVLRRVAIRPQEQREYLISYSDLSSAVYLIHVRTGSAIRTEKVLITHDR